MNPIDDLSATDRAFLDLEERSMIMHVGAVLVLGPSDLVGPDGAIDFTQVAGLLEAGLLAQPRFRQRVARVVGLGAAWVDDDTFQLEHHVQRAVVPAPGGESELFALAGVLFARPLVMDRPLWEAWIVEGLGGGRLALIVKAHHAMVDGIGGVGVLASMLPASPEDRVTLAATPRRADPPTHLGLVRALAGARVRHLADVAHDLRASLAAVGGGALAEARDVASGLATTLRTGLSPASRTPLNPEAVSARRAFLGVRLDLDGVRAVRSALGGTVNDAALAVVTGALRRVIARKGMDPDTIRSFRALVPVNLRSRTGESGIGNHVSLVLADLPIAEPDARARHRKVRESLDRLKKESHEIEGTALFERVGDLAGPNLVSLAFSIAMRLRAFNVVVTNIVGPPVPLYLAGAQVEAMFPLVPLFSHQGLSVAIVGYAGTLHLGLFSDAEVVEDLGEVREDLLAAFEELRRLAAGHVAGAG